MNIPKKQCCKSALLSGILLFSTEANTSNAVFTSECEQVVSLTERLLLEICGISGEIEYYGTGCRILFESSTELFMSQYKHLGRVFDCRECSVYFLRGIFLAKGTVNSPSSERHLEIYTESKSVTGSVSDLISEHIARPKKVKRNNKYSLYYKDTDSICDFLNLIGASASAFEIINSQIEGKIRADAQRIVNFETANIKKSSVSSAIQCKAVDSLIASGRIDQLPDDLKATALLRAEYRDLSISELAALHDPPLTKSGLNHRLKKIIAFCEEKLRGN